MADVHEPAVRSYNTSQIKGKDTKPELLVRKYLHKRGFRYSLHNKNLHGRPDMVFKKYRTVIFVNGCFWHGHKNCKYFTLPKTRTDWWKTKIERTIERENMAIQQLINSNWRVLTIWECQLRPKRMNETLKGVYEALKSRSNNNEQ